MALPYVPDDEHFYNSINQGGDLARHYQDLMAEENANTTRQTGEMAANAISNLPGNVMSGSDFSMRRAQNQQGLDIRNSEEQRAQRMFQPQLESANLENKLRGENVNQAQMQSEENMHQRGRRRAADDATAQSLGFAPGTTREDMDYAMNQRQGGANLAATRAGTSATQQGTAAGAYGLAQTKLQDTLGGIQPEAPATQPQAPVGDVADRANAAITGMQPVSATMKPQGQAGPQQPQELSPAQVAETAKKFGVSEEAVRSAYRSMQFKRAAAMKEQQMGEENFRALTPASQEVRSGVSEMKGKIQSLRQVLDSADRYKNATNDSIIAGSLPGNQGWIESEGQKMVRKQAAQTLAQLGDYEGAAAINATGLGDMSKRITDAANAAIQKETNEMDVFINAHSRFANDPEMVELKQNVEKLRQEIGNKIRQIVPPAPKGGNGMSTAGYFR